MKYIGFLILCIFVNASLPAIAQISTFPYYENFDGVVAPALPTGWSVNGFAMNTSTYHSSPNCISTTGNMNTKSITSPIFDFTNRMPDKLIFWERRSNTAATYRFEVRVSLDGIHYDSLLCLFDTISSMSGYIQRIVDLANTGLQQQPNVQFQWQLLGDSTNSTGVLRIDDVSLTVKTGFDLGLTEMVVSPLNATRNDSIILTTIVKNVGSLMASSFSIRFFYDDNFNSIAESNEQFYVLGGLSLNPGDSLNCIAVSSPLKTGERRFIVTVDLIGDENRMNDTVTTDILIGFVKGDILVNEIMYAPTGDEPEWVELYNASTDTINMNNWRVSDSNVSAKSLISGTDAFILPSSYLVVAKDVAFSMYHPGISVVITNFAVLNNASPDAVVIFDPQIHTIDSVMYVSSWGGQNGRSLERVDTKTPSTNMMNWGTSEDSSGSSPGEINSIARLDFDLTITNLAQTQIELNGRIVPIINVAIRNIGRNIADSISVRFYADSNNNAIPETSELLYEIVVPQSIDIDDSIVVSGSYTQFSSGEMRVIVVVNYQSDERTKNNQSYIIIRSSYGMSSLVINEIMYNPLEGQNEWIELFNRSVHPIDLAYWTFNDRSTSIGVNSFEISDTTMIVYPGCFAIVAAESSVCRLFPDIGIPDSNICVRILNRTGGFSLNNDGDAVILKDLTRQTIDSVAYSPFWHHSDITDTRGRSLERINPNVDSNDPRNWSTCTHLLGGSPGKANSIFTKNIGGSSGISISPNPFSPDGDGFEDFCIIHYDLSMMTSILNVRIYDIKGRLIRTLANGELAGAQGNIIWDGLDSNKQRARVGVYIIYLEATDRASDKVLTAKAVAVVAARF